MLLLLSQSPLLNSARLKHEYLPVGDVVRIKLNNISTYFLQHSEHSLCAASVFLSITTYIQAVPGVYILDRFYLGFS